LKALAAVFVCVLPAIIGAQNTQTPQVGYPPTRSPFRDLDYRQEFTIFGGEYHANRDPAGVAPQSGPAVGGRYEITVGGPTQLYARGIRVFSRRLVLNPSQPATSRNLGTVDIPLWLVDTGISVNLTGQRSFYRIVPSLATGIGIATTLRSKVENDPYQFGTSFAFSFGGGLRFVPGDRFQIRVDGGTHMYQIRYPTEYYVQASDKTSVLSAKQAKSFWKNNTSITAGISYLFFR
jgi:hypothetical protein